MIRLLLRRTTAGKLLWVAWLATLVVAAAAYRMIASSLAPAYGPSGELLYSGQDLKVGGVMSYLHDVIYITLFVQLAGCVTDYAWLAFLLVRSLPPPFACDPTVVAFRSAVCCICLPLRGRMSHCNWTWQSLCQTTEQKASKPTIRALLVCVPQIPAYALYMLVTMVLIPYMVRLAGPAARGSGKETGSGRHMGVVSTPTLNTLVDCWQH